MAPRGRRASPSSAPVRASWRSTATGAAFIAKVARTTNARHANIHARDAALLRSMDVDWEALWLVRAEQPSPGTAPVGGLGNIIPVDEHATPLEGECRFRSMPRSLDDLALLLFTASPANHVASC